MLKVTTNIQGLDKLQKEIDRLEKIMKLQSNNELNKYLKNKVWETLQKVMNERLVGGTTNDNAIDLYKNSNYIEDTTNGFILYNNAQVDVEGNLQDNYLNGKFSIALAFEYGVGITGEGTYDPGTSTFKPWEYNVKNYNFGWYYKDENGNKQHTYGYMGFEIYRYVVDEVKKNLPKWIEDYNSERVV